MSTQPSYVKVFLTFARNSLVRDMTFRSNFIIEAISAMSWMLMNLGFYILIFQYADSIGKDTGWGLYEFFVFIATTMMINSVVQAFFMPNMEEFSELIRTGGLDFALLKPIDTQFVISFHRVHWSSLGNFGFAVLLLTFALFKLTSPQPDQPSVSPDSSRSQAQVSQVSLETPTDPKLIPNETTQGKDSKKPKAPLVIQPYAVVLYPLFIVFGVVILYCLMISLAATSIWLGRNQTLYNFWFYITNFSRYPMEIYSGSLAGDALRTFFTFVIPVLVVVNVPARIMAMPLEAQNWPLAVFAVFAAVGSLLASRWVFSRALLSYRSASS